MAETGDGEFIGIADRGVVLSSRPLRLYNHLSNQDDGIPDLETRAMETEAIPTRITPSAAKIRAEYTSNEFAGPKLFHLFTGPTNAYQTITGFPAGQDTESAGQNPLGISAAVLDDKLYAQLRDKLFVPYLESIKKLTEACPGKVGKATILASTYRLSEQNLDAAIELMIKDMPEHFSDELPKDNVLSYVQGKLAQTFSEFESKLTDGIKRELGEVAKILYAARIYESAKIDNSILQVTNATYVLAKQQLLNKLATKNIDVILDALRIVDIDRDDVFIAADVGPVSDPYVNEKSSNKAEERYIRAHLPTVRALKQSGADYVYFGTMAVANEMRAARQIAENEGMPFFVSIYSDNSFQFPNQTLDTYIGTIVTELMSSTQNIGVGVNCRPTLENYAVADKVHEQIMANYEGVQEDSIQRINFAVANTHRGSDHMKQTGSGVFIPPYNLAIGLYRLFRSTDKFFVGGGICCGGTPEYQRVTFEALADLINGSSEEEVKRKYFAQGNALNPANNNASTPRTGSSEGGNIDPMPQYKQRF